MLIRFVAAAQDHAFDRFVNGELDTAMAYGEHSDAQASIEAPESPHCVAIPGASPHIGVGACRREIPRYHARPKHP